MITKLTNNYFFKIKLITNCAMAIYSLRSSEVARREGCERDGDPGHPLDFCIEVFLRSIAKKIINERQQCVGHPI